MTKEEIIAKALNTDWGREELRRGIVQGLQDGTKQNSNSFESILCQAGLDTRVFGDIPEAWESNPYEWSFDSQFDN